VRELTGRVAVVTGGASGIGRALVDRFVAEGMKVVVADVETMALDAAVEELTSRGAEVIGVRTDVSDRASVEALAEATLDAFGAVHLLCNNAGVDAGAPFEEIRPETWRWVLDVNLFGVIHGCQVFLPHLRAQEEAHIVNTGSLASFATGTPTMTPYTVSKFGLLALSESLAVELKAAGEPVGVSLLAPGLVKTRMTYSERNRPAGLASTQDHPARQALTRRLDESMASAGMEPAAVAGMVVDAVRERRFFVLTHPESAIAAVRRRLAWMETGEEPGVRTAGT
jgi:NAD(P)-dependent dehydrogenase (short-subunit alcohol dehydrogenase family)